MSEQALKVGQRILFMAHPGGPVRCGEVMEFSPSGKYVGLQVGRNDEWVQASTLSVLETWPVDDGAVKLSIVANAKAQEAAKTPQPPEGGTPNPEPPKGGTPNPEPEGGQS